jgi:hypothetical protein
MAPDKSSAAVIIVGSVFFMVAAFSPVSRVFGVADPSEKLAIIQGSGGGWAVAQILFAAGALVTAAGIGLAAYRAPPPSAAALTWSATLMGGGALLWSRHVYLRAVDPARFTAGELPLWLFAGYSLLTVAGLVFAGIAVLRMGLPPWVGWLCIGGAATFLVLGIAFGDMPPFVYYVVMLTLGIVLFRAASAGAVAATVP